MNGQAATCTTDGWKEYYQCSCGHVYTDQECTDEITNLVTWKAGDGKIAASHTLGDPIAAVEANCTDKGMKQHRECSVCGTLFDMDGNVKTAEELSIATNGTHAFGDWTSNGDGTHTRGCSHNNEHTETDNCAGGSATCTEKAICSTCNTAYGQADGHDYSEATCVAKAKCSVCGEEVGELADHNDADENGKCDVCNHQMSTIPEETTPEPTETTPEPTETTPEPTETTPEPTETTPELTETTPEPEQPTSPTTNPTTSTMPKEETKKGLSGGAIAGIVIGSTVVVAGGGFAIWWFAIQKHTVAQLGAACKSIAGKVGSFFKGIFEKIKKLFSKK